MGASYPVSNHIRTIVLKTISFLVCRINNQSSNIMYCLMAVHLTLQDFLKHD